MKIGGHAARVPIDVDPARSQGHPTGGGRLPVPSDVTQAPGALMAQPSIDLQDDPIKREFEVPPDASGIIHHLDLRLGQSMPADHFAQRPVFQRALQTGIDIVERQTQDAAVAIPGSSSETGAQLCRAHHLRVHGVNDKSDGTVRSRQLGQIQHDLRRFEDGKPARRTAMTRCTRRMRVPGARLTFRDAGKTT